MRVRVIAVGTRMPEWVRTACTDYLGRMASQLPVTITEIEAGARQSGGNPARAIATEGTRLLAALRPGEHVVALDERGKQYSTRELATWLSTRMQEGEDVALLVGGPDGHAPEVMARCNSQWSLSKLTLPHALVRVVLAEQLYRAHSILTNHPYHRD
jgi:23S rRNA (pseudouridine1915-N3)-methyltransferase